MSKKTIFTRKEFEKLRLSSALAMSKDDSLQEAALNVLVRADKYRWIHQTTWFGEPILQLPQDMFALQEIIYSVRPRYIIELGVAWGGSLLFYSTLMEVLGGEKVIGIDVYIPEDLKKRIASHKKLAKRITWIKGSSIDPDTVTKVKQIVTKSKKVLVMLDSFHTHQHVLKELQIYSKFVGKGSYIVCGDTVVDDIPKQSHRPRPWGPGNNPKTAMIQFLKKNTNFRIDKRLHNKLLISCNADGYLYKV